MTTASHDAIDMRRATWTPSAAQETLGAVRDIDFRVTPGELVALTGDMPAARTLLRLAAGLLQPHSGFVSISGIDVATTSEPERADGRYTLGGMFAADDGGLVPALSLIENVALPLRLAGVPRDESHAAAVALLARLSIDTTDRADTSYSQAERRAAAIAAALVHRPALIVLEEPTLGLEPPIAEDVFQLLRERAERDGATVLVAAQDGVILARAARVVVLRDGHIAAERVRRLAFSRGEGERVDDLTPVDDAGRLTLPPDERRALRIEERASVTRVDDHLEVRPERPPASGPDRTWRPGR